MNKKITAFCLTIIMLFSSINFVWAENKNITYYSSDNITADEAVSDSSISISEADIFTEEDIALADDNTSDYTTVNNVVLVLDKSSSMSGSKLTTLKTAAKSFCESILNANSNSKIGIVTFSSSSSEKVYGFSSSLDTLNSNIDSISAGGGTYLAVALAEANGLISNLTYSDDTVHYVNSVVIMSDGAVSDKTATKAVFDGITDSYNIYSVYLGSSSSAKSFMESIQNSGFYYAENLDELLENFGKIVNQILNPLDVSLMHGESTDGFVESYLIKQYEIAAVINNTNINAVTNVSVTLNLPDAFVLDTSVNPQTVTLDKISDDETIIIWKASVYQVEEDCNYEISVDVACDDLSTMTISNQISVPGYNSGSKVFDTSSDIWSFENYSSSNYNINSDVLNGLLMNYSSNADKEAIKNRVNSPTGGHCYGMSATAVLAKSGELKASEMNQGAANIHAVSKADADETISFYQLSQFFSIIHTEMHKFEDNSDISTQDALEAIANNARQVEYGANPAVVVFELKEINLEIFNWDINISEGGSHAVVCYDYERLSGDDEVKINFTTYNTRLSIYDPNFPNAQAQIYCNTSYDSTNQKVIMDDDKYIYYVDINSWFSITPYFIDHFSGMINDIDAMNIFDTKILSDNYSSWVSVNADIAYSNGLNIKYGTNKNAIGSTGLQDNNGMNGHFDIGESTSSERYYNIYFDETEPVELYYDDDTVGNIGCSVLYDDFYCAADADSAGKAVLEPDGQASLENVNSDYELAVTANDEYMVMPWYTVSVSGTSEASNPTLSISDDGYIFEGESLSNVTVTANNDDETKELTFDSDETSVLITSSNNELVVMTDSNNDGKYDKTIASTSSNNSSSGSSTSSNKSGSGGSGSSVYIGSSKTVDESANETADEEENSDTISSEIKISIGSNIVTIDGEEFEIEAAPYIQPESSSTLVPLRFVATAVLGGNVQNADTSSIISWDAETKTAYITVGNDVISFTAGSEYVTINGKTVLMSNGVKAEITDGRMFIPFRALGEALGVKVDWDSETKTAIYTRGN